MTEDQKTLAISLSKVTFVPGIHLLTGWQNSKGATLEHHISERLEMIITYANGETQS